MAVGIPLAARRLPPHYAAVADPAFLASRETRLAYFFGHCEPAGYGYLKRVLAVYARLERNQRKRPVIRYRDFNRRSEYLFEPSRFEADASVLVGIGLGPEDTQEGEVGRARQTQDGSWQFTTGTAADLLTRIEISLERGDARDFTLHIYRRERDTVPAWTANVSREKLSPGQSLQFVVAPALSGFRAGPPEPFVVRLQGHVSVHHIAAYGVRVDLEGYHVIHRAGACFVAVRDGRTRAWSQLAAELGHLDD